MVGEVILVAVDASKDITDYSLEWAVRNVIKPMDSLILLAILPSSAAPPLLSGKTASLTFYQFLTSMLKRKRDKRSNRNNFNYKNADDGHEQSQRTYNMCLQMMRKHFKMHNIVKVRTDVKVVANIEGNVTKVASELGATWVILDRRLKKEGDCSMKQLINCNVILIDREIQKVLRSVKLSKTEKFNDGAEYLINPTVADMLGSFINDGSIMTHASSLGIEDQNSKTDTCSLSLSSSTRTNSDHFHKTQVKQADIFSPLGNQYFQHKAEVESKYQSTTRYSKSQPLNKMVLRDLDAPHKSTSGLMEGNTVLLKSRSVKFRTEINRRNGMITDQTPQVAPWRSTRLSRYKQPSPNKPRQEMTRREFNRTNEVVTIDRMSSIRKAISVSIKQPPIPPPLCSVCKNNAPVFGRAPRKFTHKEIEEATYGFSKDNFLAKGGFGRVYKGVLGDGQVVAVKQHTALSAQGASEFCSEVEVLSCAQHKNLVMLVGYCIEIEWLLVYEFACNDSLDKHLYGTGEPMAWHNRMKVAVGAARGLRYLHEDCRVGCIVHRDFRPNNILLTHDFEPMVGDFGLARWQADGQSAEETRVIGAFGYLAPEYTQTGLITEKADVYAFGVVLLELLTGIKPTEFSRNARQLPELRQQFLERKACSEIIDPRLEMNYVDKEVECMRQAATSCISPHPQQRPRMSEVLRILEGDMPAPMANPHLESASVFPNQSLNNDYYAMERPTSHEMPENNNRVLKEPIRRMELNRSHIKENQSKRIFKKTTSNYSSENKLTHANTTPNTKPPSKVPLASEEEEYYQEYLQGSLSRYIQNLNIDW